MAPQGNLLARAEAVVERAYRIAAEHHSALAQARIAVQPLRDVATRRGGDDVPQAADRPRTRRPA
ncbi:hypothetical protein [Methylobacterium nonmethylotrophicum]|uniref:Uncharacterized protein n=1 Tax=Methylobacterium nonmethylotrophicum TaxID=1141884 RepID=A0A4Z0NX14_9HYPH|nr:hypothetical protein [Methylobacterium nonmethylotrophicum]TGE01827.1 hypothetical protein EU555_03915 [Methylobacterium nonmethylotrophicum]